MPLVQKDAEIGQEGHPPATLLSATPLYVKLKDYVRSRVETGEWKIGQRVPSENELVDILGVSRMTANRALRELADEGLVVRLRGKGSFVATRKRTSQFQSVPNIADEIRRNGGIHSARVILLQMEACGEELAEALGVSPADPVAHSIIMHAEDGLPMQIEDRFVNPGCAPDYLYQDFNAVTPNGYLTEVAPIVKAEQHIESVNAQAWECKLWRSRSPNHACLCAAVHGRLRASFLLSACSIPAAAIVFTAAREALPKCRALTDFKASWFQDRLVPRMEKRLCPSLHHGPYPSGEFHERCS